METIEIGVKGFCLTGFAGEPVPRSVCEYSEYRKGGGGTIDANERVALLDYAIHRGQVKSSALPRFLGGKKWLKNVGFGGIVHSLTIVSDRETHVITGSHRRAFGGFKFIHE